MRTLIYLINKVFNIPLIIIFKYSGFVTRIILLLSIYYYCKKFIIKSDKTLLFIPLLAFSSYYFMYRSWITFPENYVLIFHSLTLIITTKLLSAKKDSKNYLLFILLGINTAATIYFHRPSFIVTGVMNATFIFIYLYLNKFNKNSFKIIIFYILFTILISLPVLGGLLSEYKNQISWNVGSNSSYSSVAKNLPLYKKPTVDTFIFYSSILLLTFFISGLVLLLKNISTTNIQLLIYVFFTFFLSISTYFNIYLPTDRMQGFFMIPLILVSFIGLNYHVATYLKKSKILISILIVTFFYIAIINISSSYGWYALSKGEINVSKYINNLINKTSDKIYIDQNINLTLLRISNPKNITTKIKNAKYIITNKTIHNVGSYILEKNFGDYEIYKKQ